MILLFYYLPVVAASAIVLVRAARARPGIPRRWSSWTMGLAAAAGVGQAAVVVLDQGLRTLVPIVAVLAAALVAIVGAVASACRRGPAAMMVAAGTTAFAFLGAAFLFLAVLAGMALGEGF